MTIIPNFDRLRVSIECFVYLYRLLIRNAKWNINLWRYVEIFESQIYSAIQSLSEYLNGFLWHNYGNEISGNQF